MVPHTGWKNAQKAESHVHAKTSVYTYAKKEAKALNKKRITGPFEDEKQQMEWQKEALREDIEHEKDLRRRVFFDSVQQRPGSFSERAL